MIEYKKGKALLIALSVFVLSITLAACGGGENLTSNDPEYENQKITVEGLPDGVKEITVSELRSLPQQSLDASYKRTTGMYEEFKMEGPLLRDVISELGGDILEYEGVGIMGRDAYYCLISKEVINSTPDLLLATVIDGEAKLDEIDAPARLAVQGQFGPYWVRNVDKITLYKEVPKKKITSVWVFNNLAEGIEPYEYEYYGSKDDAIELEQIFSRLDYVDNKAFFTMKSSDGFKKNEALNMVKSRYYIKTEGEDAPTNISPYIKLGMNVKNISWISTNADAAIFPEQMGTYMDIIEVNGEKGISLYEIMLETEVKEVSTQSFDVLGTNGEKERVSGEDLKKGILVHTEDGNSKVIWDKETGYKNIDNLLRVRLVQQ